MPHVHVHAPHELGEPPEPAAAEEAKPTAGRERWLELSAVLLLSLATLATAWSGYQAALWSGEQSQRYSQASALRVRADEDTVTLHPLTNPQAPPGPTYMPHYHPAPLVVLALPTAS